MCGSVSRNQRLVPFDDRRHYVDLHPESYDSRIKKQTGLHACKELAVSCIRKNAILQSCVQTV